MAARFVPQLNTFYIIVCITKKETQKPKIEEHISSFQQTKTGEKTYSQSMGQAKVLKKVNNSHNNHNNNSSSGLTNTLFLTLIVTFAIGIAVGIGYMLYKFNIGG